VLGWEPRAEGVRVETDQGTYDAERLIVTAGAWAEALIPELRGLAVPERQVLAWLQPDRPELFTPGRFPVFNLQVDEGRYYGLPIAVVPGFKLGRYHHLEETTTGDQVDRECHPRDEAVLRSFAESYFPDGAGPTMALRACLFTNTPDEHFVLDVHPRYPQVSIASPCSGHGFKFSSVVGEIMADLATSGQTAHDISLFRLSRFAPPGPPG
jgi:sarcosine oxidase